MIGLKRATSTGQRCYEVIYIKPKMIHTPVKYRKCLKFFSYTSVLYLKFDINKTHKKV